MRKEVEIAALETGSRRTRSRVGQFGPRFWVEREDIFVGGGDLSGRRCLLVRQAGGQGWTGWLPVDEIKVT